MALPPNGISEFLASSGETEDERKRRQWLAGQVEDAPTISVPEGWAADAAAYFGIPLANDNESGNPYDDTLTGPRPWKPQDVLPFLAGIDQIPSNPEGRVMGQVENFLPVPFLDAGIQGARRLLGRGAGALQGSSRPRVDPGIYRPTNELATGESGGRFGNGSDVNAMFDQEEQARQQFRDAGIDAWSARGGVNAPENYGQDTEPMSINWDRAPGGMFGSDLNPEAFNQIQDLNYGFRPATSDELEEYLAQDADKLTAPPKGPGGTDLDAVLREYNLGDSTLDNLSSIPSTGNDGLDRTIERRMSKGEKPLDILRDLETYNLPDAERAAIEKAIQQLREGVRGGDDMDAWLDEFGAPPKGPGVDDLGADYDEYFNRMQDDATRRIMEGTDRLDPEELADWGPEGPFSTPSEEPFSPPPEYNDDLVPEDEMRDLGDHLADSRIGPSGLPEDMVTQPFDQPGWPGVDPMSNTMDFNTFLDQNVLDIPPWAKRIRDSRWRQN